MLAEYRNKLWLSAILMFVCLLTNGQEKQIPILPDNTFVIDNKMAISTSVFTGYEEFVEAKLFQISDSLFVLEISYLKDDSQYKDRKYLTKIEKQNLQVELFRKISKHPKEVNFDYTGRSALTAASVILSLGYNAWALPTALNVDDTRKFSALYTLGGAAGFFVPWLSTKKNAVTWGQASLSYYGQSRGIAYGTMLSAIIKPSPNSSELFGSGVIGSVAGGFAGYHFAKKWGFNFGDAAIMQAHGDFGMLSGFLLADILNLYDRNIARPVFTTALISSAAGLYVGKRKGDTHQYTKGDVIAFKSGVFLSAYLSLVLINYAKPDDSQPYSVGILVGSTIGYLYTNSIIRDQNFTAGQGVLISLGEMAGGLLGLGIGYFLTPDINEPDIFLTASALGAVTGYGLMFRHFSRKAQKGENSKMSLNFHFNPLGLTKITGNFYKNGIYPELLGFRCTF